MRCDYRRAELMSAARPLIEGTTRNRGSKSSLESLVVSADETERPRTQFDTVDG